MYPQVWRKQVSVGFVEGSAAAAFGEPVDGTSWCKKTASRAGCRARVSRVGTHHRRAGWWVFGCSALAASTARGRRCGFSCRPALRALRSNCRAAPPVATTLVASEISPSRVLALTRLDKTGVIGRRRSARPARKRAFCAVLSFPCTHSSRRTATAGFAAVRLRRSPARLLRGR